MCFEFNNIFRKYFVLFGKFSDFFVVLIWKRPPPPRLSYKNIGIRQQRGINSRRKTKERGSVLKLMEGRPTSVARTPEDTPEVKHCAIKSDCGLVMFCHQEGLINILLCNKCCRGASVISRGQGMRDNQHDQPESSSLNWSVTVEYQGLYNNLFNRQAKHKKRN